MKKDCRLWAWTRASLISWAWRLLLASHSQLPGVATVFKCWTPFDFSIAVGQVFIRHADLRIGSQAIWRSSLRWIGLASSVVRPSRELPEAQAILRDSIRAAAKVVAYSSFLSRLIGWCAQVVCKRSLQGVAPKLLQTSAASNRAMKYYPCAFGTRRNRSYSRTRLNPCYGSRTLTCASGLATSSWT